MLTGLMSAPLIEISDINKATRYKAKAKDLGFKAKARKFGLKSKAKAEA